jgi:hypothetical protein
VHAIFKALSAGQLDWTLMSNEYLHDKMTGQTSGKMWRFEVSFTNNKGRPTKMYGTITASFAGSVEDPGERYDLVAYIS